MLISRIHHPSQQSCRTSNHKSHTPTLQVAMIPIVSGAILLLAAYFVVASENWVSALSTIPTASCCQRGSSMSSIMMHRLNSSYLHRRNIGMGLEKTWRISQLNLSTNNNSDNDKSFPAPERKKKKKSKKNENNKSLFRADRVLSNRGFGTRSECFELLKKKRVFQEINSEMKCILGPSAKIPMNVPLFVDGKIEVPKPPPILRIYNKPKWVLSVMKDAKGRKNLGELKETFFSNMHPVGRLDYDSEGLLLWSSDGQLTQKLLHPNNKVEKEYVAIVVGNVEEDNLREILSQGVKTSMGSFPANLIGTKSIPKDEVKTLIDNIINNLPPEYDMKQLEEKGHLFFKDADELSEVRVVVEEGKHRMVRRILANSGYPVIGLKRERLGIITLSDLHPGCARDLTPEEEKWAKSLLKRKT
ncbi:MAG: 23S rRNA pseudouridine2605 synthase [Bacillariaceae sp.]|jgi:23S rRNA pseudouridine2605 synthase